MSGWLLIDKPEGISSAKALNAIKRFVRPAKVGHAGTLDPFASGLLVVGIGQATRLMEYAVQGSKEYEFTIAFGENRDTIDPTGKVIASSTKIPSEGQVIGAISKFLGEIEQVPPAFSAIKINGQRAYDLARRGQEIELTARRVKTYELKLTNYNSTESSTESTFFLHCSKGYYVRSLAYELCRELGVCGYVSRLRRLKSGNFLIKDAISLESLEKVVHNSDCDAFRMLLRNPSCVLDDILVQQVDVEAAKRIRNGLSITAEDFPAQSEVAVMCGSSLVAICKTDGCRLRPYKVFN